MSVTNVKRKCSKGWCGVGEEEEEKQRRGGGSYGGGWESGRLKRLIEVESKREVGWGSGDTTSGDEREWRESSRGWEMEKNWLSFKDTKPQVGLGAWNLEGCGVWDHPGGQSESPAPGKWTDGGEEGRKLSSMNRNQSKCCWSYCLWVALLSRNIKQESILNLIVELISRDMRYFVQWSVCTKQTNQIYYV